MSGRPTHVRVLPRRRSPDLADALSITFYPRVQRMDLVDMTRGFVPKARRSPGYAGPSSPRPRYGERFWAEDVDEVTNEPPPGWDEAKQTPPGELRLGPRPPRL